ncbi:MAG: DUF4395 domain-containing protein [Nocardioides sp.]|uniref:DUF4395 domain-containing protein n=1 Tax=Nocardioides sp. TaxID=35761 RepID=UPI0039E512FE
MSHSPSPLSGSSPGGPGVDPRGQRFAATVTAVILAAVLILAPGLVATLLLAAQVVLFAIAAIVGVKETPHAWVFRSLIRPRLGAPTELEDPAPPRFAQGVGLVFATVGLIGLLTGATTLGLVATGLALAAAVLNAVFGFCLGCELYLLKKRITTRNTPTITPQLQEKFHVS